MKTLYIVIPCYGMILVSQALFPLQKIDSFEKAKSYYA